MSAPPFELLDVPYEVEIVCPEWAMEFCDNVVNELWRLGVPSRNGREDCKHTCVSVAGRRLLILLDGETCPPDEFAFARLTTNKRLKDAQCLAQNIITIL
jgi:hypothetical protein